MVCPLYQGGVDQIRPFFLYLFLSIKKARSQRTSLISENSALLGSRQPLCFQLGDGTIRLKFSKSLVDLFNKFSLVFADHNTVRFVGKDLADRHQFVAVLTNETERGGIICNYGVNLAIYQIQKSQVV